jgi:hypothetical protein
MPGLNRPDLDFATIAAPFPEPLERSGAAWAVIHAPAASPLYGDMPPDFRRRMAIVARRLAGRLEEAWGPPDLVRSDGAAWDLDRVRRLVP